jgi:hypothetical protein
MRVSSPDQDSARARAASGILVDGGVARRYTAARTTMTTPRTPEGEAALTRACDEQGLQLEYRDCVRPLLTMPETQWPRCCGRGCEPCADTLVVIARRVRELLAG